MRRRYWFLRTRWQLFGCLLFSLLILSFLLGICITYSASAGSSAAQRTTNLHRYPINCSAIYDMDLVEVEKSLWIRRQRVVEEVSDEALAELTSDCSSFLKIRGYENVCFSEEEQLFPLAYSLVVHKSAWMVERLIRTLYSPTNVFCIHYDLKSPPQFISAMKGLARCLPNVFISSQLENVVYASFSRLKADLNCLSDLLRSDVQWKYVINLCGQDFPLRSNMELVSELKNLNGANMLETKRPSKAKKKRFTFHHQLKNSVLKKTDQVKTEPPHGIQIFIGSAYFVLSHQLVLHMNSSEVVRDLLAWSEDTYSPDEHFWATLVRLPGVPGEVPVSQPDITDLMSRTRLVKWEYLEEYLYPPCSGQHVRSVCIFGAAELRWLLNYGHLFANKFDLSVDPVVVQCLEEKLQERQRLFESVALHLICPKTLKDQ
ncbi:beta-1,3-galactosyl-O-glycosyl-glycoprotein beta-1,6-N-acetylglucosaminyltransferase 4-like [Gouania willdenowi]|uniref:Beta-1,3-galactosyl-O-glycosyl-glycoprotein beta-1,6-N-acetylglucosaminyltransferase 4-like n=1 Tax=Gouania willdenowi TaxID=441366 RepID=A0A8C5DIB1_GOUWI|nr:beta-1,3-galactosyl-O-glycosyl-glycoprotein beta-1,6-N-acetylglucosaminyltransferase 4-like [Gouania willdenowi]